MNDRSLTEHLLHRDRLLIVAMLFLLFALAGVYTVSGIGMRMSALEMTAMQGMRDMPGPTGPGDWPAGYAILVFLMWWVMMVGMMLPSTSPTVLLYAALLRRGQEAHHVPGISTAFLGGYISAWAGFSVFATVAQWFLESQGMLSATMMTLIDTVPGALVLIGAGIFQFTPLKQICLRQCRSPIEFITRHRRPGASGAFIMGLEHGTYCLGCCWFLMALLFVGGIMNLFWIVALATLVALEKLSPYGDIVCRIAGVGLIGWGIYVIGASL